mgnify:CR=1 FL=1
MAPSEKVAALRAIETEVSGETVTVELPSLRLYKPPRSGRKYVPLSVLVDALGVSNTRTAAKPPGAASSAAAVCVAVAIAARPAVTAQ